jgi:hypothetical protein
MMNMSSEATEERVIENILMDEEGRMTLKLRNRRASGCEGKRAVMQAENYGKDKIVLTILSRYDSPKANKGIRTRLETSGRPKDLK